MALGKGRGALGLGEVSGASGNSLLPGASFICLLTTMFYQDKSLLSVLSLDPTCREPGLELHFGLAREESTEEDFQRLLGHQMAISQQLCDELSINESET